MLHQICHAHIENAVHRLCTTLDGPSLLLLNPQDGFPRMRSNEVMAKKGSGAPQNMSGGTCGKKKFVNTLNGDVFSQDAARLGNVRAFAPVGARRGLNQNGKWLEQRMSTKT